MKIILPTKRGWTVIGLAFGMFILSLIRPGFTPALFASLLVAMLITGFISAFLSLQSIDVVREPSVDGYRGMTVNLPVTIHNRSRRTRQSIVITEKCGFSAEKMDCHVVTPLGPGEKRYVSRPIAAAYRGEYELTELVLRGGDPTGVFCCRKRFREAQKLLIMPELQPISWLPLTRKEHSRASVIGHTAGDSGTGQDFFGLREYRMTDGIRVIDWRATARQQRLMVREFEENAAYMISIFLDVDQRHINKDRIQNNFEFLVTTAASLVRYLAGLNCHVFFSAGTDPEQQFSGSAQTIHDQVFDCLTYLQPSEINIVDQLDTAYEKVAPNSIAYILTLNEAPDIEKALEVFLLQDVECRWVVAPPALFQARFQFERERAAKQLEANRSQLLEPVVVTPELDITDILVKSQDSKFVGMVAGAWEFEDQPIPPVLQGHETVQSLKTEA